MDAYHLAIFGAGWCPTQPIVGDKRKRYDKPEHNKPSCVAVGGDVYLYTRNDTASQSQQAQKAKTSTLPAVKEEERPRPALTRAAKANMLQKTRQASRRWSDKGKTAFAGATASMKNLFASKPTPSSLEDDDDVPKPRYKKLKLSPWGDSKP